MRPQSSRGDGGVTLLVALALVALGVIVMKPKIFHGDSRRADKSVETTAALVDATAKQAAEAAASVVKIGEANATAPESPEKSFIAREVPVALAKLPAPDPRALIEAERRKAAVLAGRLEEANRLYGVAMERADKLERERAAALAAKRASDAELERVAAERLGAERLMNWALAVAGLCVVLWLYAHITRPSVGALAEAVKDIKAGNLTGNAAIAALDGVTTRLQQRLIRFFQP
jgi:hypothetical protein